MSDWVFVPTVRAIGLSSGPELALDPEHGQALAYLGDIEFKKNNLDVEIIYMPGNISAPSLMAGEIQFGQTTGALMSPRPSRRSSAARASQQAA